VTRLRRESCADNAESIQQWSSIPRAFIEAFGIEYIFIVFEEYVARRESDPMRDWAETLTRLR
jgi:hypothetical protein